MNQPVAPLQWDIFCRVIDNFGDIGVCWRLATQLAGQGQQVRLAQVTDMDVVTDARAIGSVVVITENNGGVARV